MNEEMKTGLLLQLTEHICGHLYHRHSGKSNHGGDP